MPASRCRHPTSVLWLGSPGASFVVGVGLPVGGSFTAHRAKE